MGRGRSFLLALFLLAPVSARAQSFGQNHVVLDDFQWKVRSTEHFDVYYYEGSSARVTEAAEYLEKGFKAITRSLDIPIEPPLWASEAMKKRSRWKRRPFFLYASPNDFQQSNIAQVGDGTGGVTEPFKDRFMVYNDGSRQWLEEVTIHELVHIFQFHVLIGGWWKSGAILKTIVYPLWMMEGMAGYLTHGIESTLEEMTIRDAATSSGLLSLVRLEHFGHLKPHQVTLAYKQGAAAMAFLAEQYGPKTVGRMLKLFESRFETSSVLNELIGLDVFQFDKKYREHLEEKYARIRRLERLKEPEAYGAALTRTTDGLPQFNSAPVFTPDGRTMFFFSTRAGHPPVIYEQDLKSGRTKALTNPSQTRIENMPLGHFANLSRVLSLSKDGRRLVWAGTRNHRDSLYVYDLEARRLKTLPLPGFQTASQPSFSPDGTMLAFSGMKDAVSDIYLYDLASGQVTRLTRDPEDDEMPVFTPDGTAIVYSSETSDGRRLYRFDLKDGAVTRLESLSGEARDPLVSEDGRKILFVLENRGFSEICELDLATGRAVRLTRSIGGSFTPTYAPGDELAFAALRRGNVHLFKGPRSDFEGEAVEPARSPDAALAAVAPSTATVALTPERPYKFTASTDLFLPAAFYSSQGGFFWTSYWQGSDLLGNHQAVGLMSVASGSSFDYAARYSYSRFRPALFAGAQGLGRRGLYDPDNGQTFNDSVHAQFLGVSYPFDRTHRVETSLAAISERVRYDAPGLRDDRQARVVSAALVRDAVRGRYLVATSGNRARLFFDQAVGALGGSRRYETIGVEAHQFLPTGSQSALALRAVGLESAGRDHPNLLLGGLGGVRGYARSTTEDNGSRLALANAEWRFPLKQDINYYMWYFFPDFYFKALYGSVFTDAGYAWNTPGQLGHTQWRQVRNSVGLGLRLYTFILQEFPLVISADYARRTTQNGGIFYVYLGTLF